MQAERLTMGDYRQTQHSLNVVYGACNTFSENWVTLTEWLSVVRRLRELEASMSVSAGDKADKDVRAAAPTDSGGACGSSGNKCVWRGDEDHGIASRSTRTAAVSLL